MSVGLMSTAIVLIVAVLMAAVLFAPGCEPDGAVADAGSSVKPESLVASSAGATDGLLLHTYVSV